MSGVSPYPPAEAVAKTGFSLDTLRYYEKIGLLRGIQRDTGGWVRFINPYNGSVISEHANENRQGAAHAQLLWQATERALTAPRAKAAGCAAVQTPRDPRG